MAWDGVFFSVFGLLLKLVGVAIIAVGCFYGYKLAAGIGRDVHGTCEGVIVSKAYTPDTQQTSAVPVATGKGMGVGVVTTGNPEAFVSLIKITVDGKVSVEQFESRELWALASIGQSVTVHYKTNPQWPLSLESIDFVESR
jgi:hypothetical protein